MYKKLTHEWNGILTGKGIQFGGSLIRPEATGYGNVYFLVNMLKTRDIDIKGKTVLVSGSGNVAQYTIEKCIELGAKVLTCSDAKILYSPGKAANAGGVAVSGLEMSQNSERLSWSREEVDAKLHAIMNNIHDNCVKYGTEADGYINYVKGANIAGFLKVAKGMIAQGIV